MIVFIPFFHRDYIHSMIHWEEFKEKSRTCLVSYIKELKLHSFGTLRALFFQFALDTILYIIILLSYGIYRMIRESILKRIIH